MDQNHLNTFERGPPKDHSCEVWPNQSVVFEMLFKICGLTDDDDDDDGRLVIIIAHLSLIKQEDHNGPISLTWAKLCILTVEISGKFTALRFLYKCYSPDPQRQCFFQASWWFELNLERGSPKEQFCQVILKSVQWFLTKRFFEMFYIAI